MTEITTIKIKKKTKERFEKLRVYRRETYDDIAQRIFNILGTCRIDSVKAQEKLKRIECEARRLIKKEREDKK